MIDDEDKGGRSALGLHEIAAIAIRRRWWLIVPFVLGTIAALVAAMTMQPIYQSSATLLIESQEVPTTLVASPFTSYADERIAKIRQQIMSRPHLIELVERHNLYPTERQALPIDDVLNKLRAAIGVNLVSADAGNGGRSGNATIAFNLSFTYTDPATANQVTEQLTRMFIDEDKRLRTEQVSGTAAFLARRADELRDRLVALENRRRTVQARYNGALPDQIALSSQSSAALRAEVSRIDAETQGILQQNSLLAARSQELASLPRPAESDVRRAEAELNRLTGIYSDTHPDVIAARATLARARASAAAEPSRTPGASTLAAEIQAGRARAAMLARRRAELVAAIANADRLTAMSPQAAYELNNLARDYDNLKQQYQDIREKQLEAQVAANLQAEGKGERFSVVDPPSMPYAPISPKRLQLLMMGIVGGLGAGMALVLAFELIAVPVHGPAAIAKLTGEAPLITVPRLRPGAMPSHLTRFDRLLLWWRQRSRA